MRRLHVEERSGLSFSDMAPKFDVARNRRLVPQIRDTDVVKYFPQFEKIVQDLQWT